MNEDDTIHIALAANQNFYPGLLVTAASIANFANRECKLYFHILDGGISDHSIDVLKKKVALIHSNSRFQFYPISEAVFSKYPQWRNTGRMAYARLLLGDLLPKDISHVIYCDTDFLWLRDISDLWKQRSNEITFISTRHGVKSTEDQEAKWFGERHIPFNPQRHFCSGLSFFNLVQFRKRNLFTKAMDFLSQHTDVNAVDESALNAILFNEQILLTDQSWAKFTFTLTRDTLSVPQTLHFSSRAPWKNLFSARLLTDATLLWFQFYSRVKGIPTRKALREFYSSDRIILSRLTFVLLAKIPIVSPILQSIMHKLLPNTFAQIQPYLVNLHVPLQLSQDIAQIETLTIE